MLVALSMGLCATWCMLGVTLQICLWRLPFQLTVTAKITNSADSCTNSLSMMLSKIRGPVMLDLICFMVAICVEPSCSTKHCVGTP